MAKLGDYANFIMGQAPASSECNSNGVGTPFVKAGQFGLSTPVIDEWTTNPLKMASNKDVLICVVGATSGKLNRGVECAIGRSVAAIRPNEKTIRDYIYYGLHPWIKRLRGGSQGSAIGVITKDMLDAVEMPFPGKERQKEIVKTLSLIENIIEKRKEELKKFDPLIKAQFVEMFGDPVTDTMKWGQKPLKDFLKSIRYGTSTPPKFTDYGYAFIRATNIKAGRIVDDDMKFINQQEADRLEKCKLSGGEIIIVRSGVNAGDTCIITDKYIGQYAGYDMIIVLNEMLNPAFLNMLINTTYMERVVKPMTRRAAQPHLNAEQTQSFPIICVPRKLQDEFAEFVQQVDKSKVAVQKALDETQLLFDSLMQEYFG